MTHAKKDPRVIRTQRLLRAALIDLMEERELEQITVQDIAERATVKRATFYLHYEDKQALLTQCIDELLNELREQVDTAESDYESFDYLSGEPHPSFVRLFHHISVHYNFYTAMLVKNRVAPFAEGLLKVIHEFVSRGIDRTEPDDGNLTARREVVVKYVESAFLEVIIWWLERQMPYSESDMAAQLMNLSIHGPYIRIPGRRNPQ
ncbi:transcriptional regulator BetI [Paenibacillus konkukensis]|uniref:Transcriptional regulator BetI n=1 Tax=Paenibacillus konkukensis TaxID=2020716 RepID=A0ABY4RXG3_9BACL|nr:TetR/AcrR family transcriptional regulator [Paenibacillus konkukensis]UQZ86099.1 transcriptional regulator BetI [Paenibacillus konkukensis]